MGERFINEGILQNSAIKVVNRLKEVAANHERTYPYQIEAVLVFSGPGTYYARLKPGQEERLRWMDRDRIRAGVAVVREVTTNVASGMLEIDINSQQVQKEDILPYGPYFVYNGIPVENRVFRKALESEFCKLPKEKVVIIDEVNEENSLPHPIRHTADQIKSFYQEIQNPESPLHGIHNVALVSHIPHFARIVFYTQKYNDEYIERGYPGLNFWVYGLKDRPGTEVEYLESELESLVDYAKRGHLAAEPSSFST